jgi:putative ABC transport system substrate-binding protein
MWNAALRSHGYVEGENLALERRHGLPDGLPALAAELARFKLDLISCGGSAPVRALMAASRDAPVIAIDLETDPVASGFAASLAHPGGT